MITENKGIELFCMADHFCNLFDAIMTKYTFRFIIRCTDHCILMSRKRNNVDNSVVGGKEWHTFINVTDVDKQM